jgi:hypothetical protein
MGRMAIIFAEGLPWPEGAEGEEFLVLDWFIERKDTAGGASPYMLGDQGEGLGGQNPP